MDTIVGCSLVIYDENNNVLIAQRSRIKHRFPLLWETVGGTLEGEETPEECIRREVKEELNCKINDLKLFKVYIINSDDRYVLITFTGQISGNIQPNVEIEKVEWVNEDSIHNYNFMGNCKEKILDFYKFASEGDK
jgi:8-oxo-dGTP diphosphatase